MANEIGYYVHEWKPALAGYGQIWQPYCYCLTLEKARDNLSRLKSQHRRARIVDSEGLSLKYAPNGAW
jgi:hypothetical protein